MSDDSIYRGFGYAKTLIFGEYAVMHGAPGLIMAMPQKMHLTLELTPCVSQPESQFAQVLQKQLLNHFGLLGNIFLDDSQFFDSNHIKYGIGSSAAGVVALCRAAIQAIKPPSEFSLPQAIQIHREIQHGLGSGIDIHASALGGILSVCHCPDHPQYQTVPAHNLPCIAVLAAHHPSLTTDYLTAAKRVESTSEYTHIIAALSDVYASLTQFVNKANHSAFLELIPRIPELLKQLEVIIDRKIIPDGFELLVSIGCEHHVVLKTSGAGGGDILLAMSQNRHQLDSFLSQIPPNIPLTLLNNPSLYERAMP